MKFIDLFSGLGGFHTGFAKNGYECVFASEINEDLRSLYKANYGIEPHGDITKVREEDIPTHDVICAGFPCQPFSLAGKKKGAECPTSGRLIDDVVRIAKYHKPKFVVLENVPNVLSIANGAFWEYVVNSFNAIGYHIDHRIISPVDIGIPQNRKRVFIVATRNDVEITDDIWPVQNTEQCVALMEFLEPTAEHKKLEPRKLEQLNTWQVLLNNCQLPSRAAYSIVAPEFGADYPLNFGKISLSEMKQYKGAYGQSLAKCKTWDEVMTLMPAYTQKNKTTADWIKPSIQLSRDIYAKHSQFIQEWLPSLDKNNNSWQILEWRGHLNRYDLRQHLIQFRASGIRVLRPEVAPSLIAMTPTQIPIVLKEQRYLSKHEAAKLQFLHELLYIPENTTKAFKAFGNAVNAKIVGMIASNLEVYI